MLKFAIVTGVLVLWGMTSPAIAMDKFELQCSKLPGGVEVIVKDTPVQFNYTVSIKELQKLKSPSTSGYAHPGITIGLTKATSTFKATYALPGLTLGERACVRPKITIELSNSPQTVYVAKEFRQDSCAFSIIFNHEMRHVRANSLNLESTANDLKHQLQQQLKNKVFYGNPDKYMADLKDAMEQYWKPYVMGNLAKANVLHSQIDTPEEYASNNTACGGEIPKVLNGSLRM